MLAIQTGLRLSELIGIRCRDIILTKGAHVRCFGKGRKERCTPLTKQTVAVIKNWLKERAGADDDVVFPNARGTQLSPDGVQYLLAKHVATARQTCPTLKDKRVSPHVLRHTAAMELLQAGVDHSMTWNRPQGERLSFGHSLFALKCTRISHFLKLCCQSLLFALFNHVWTPLWYIIVVGTSDPAGNSIRAGLLTGSLSGKCPQTVSPMR